MSGKNILFKSSKTIRLRWDFLPEPDFCQIWKKCRIPAGAGAEIWYSPTLVLLSTLQHFPQGKIITNFDIAVRELCSLQLRSTVSSFPTQYL